MTCTQCSGSHGLAASEAPWGQDLPLTTPTPFTHGLSLRKAQQPGPPQRHGEVGVSPSSLARLRRGAAGCTEGSETLGPCVSALEPPRSSWGTYGALHAAPPFSFYAAMFLCCQVGPLGPFGSAWGRGRVPAAPCLGPHLGTWTPSALHRALFPAWLSQGQVRSALAWKSLQTVSRREASPHASSVGAAADPAPLPRGYRRGEDLLPLVRAAGVCPSGPSPASLDSSLRAAPHSTQGSAAQLPQLQVWGHRQDPLWCHINMYMCI